MKVENSPPEVTAVTVTGDAVSGEAMCEDRFSDDEHETELEALQHLPAEERRKALRRLRNRESARRVRARRLQEMSVMENTVSALQEENTALKAHVSKLQNHIQSMTLKIYESSNPGDSSFIAPAATAGPLPSCGMGAEPETSPFVAPCSGGGPGAVGRRDSGSAGQLGGLSCGHAQLRSSSPMDMAQQKQALEEVVALLQAHKRRNQAAAQDRSNKSEIGSSAPPNTTAVKSYSPPLDAPTPAAAPLPLLGGAAFGSQLTYSGSGTGPSAANATTNAGPLSALQYGGNGNGSVGNQLGGLALHSRGTPPPLLDGAAGAVSRGRALSDAVGGQLQQQQQQMQFAAAQQGPDSSGPLCHLSLSASGNLGPLGGPLHVQQQLQQPQHSLAAHQGLGVGPSYGMFTHERLQQQQQQETQHLQHQQQHQQALLMQQAAMQGRGQSFVQLQALHQQQQLQFLQHPHHQQHHQQQQQAGGPALQASQLQAGGSGVMYSGVSALSGTFHSASSFLAGSGGGAAGVLQLQGQAAGDLGSGTGGQHGARGGPLSLQSLERAACATGNNVVAMAAPGVAAWQCGGVGLPGSVGLAPLRADDITEELFRSLEEYVPQDL